MSTFILKFATAATLIVSEPDEGRVNILLSLTIDGREALVAGHTLGPPPREGAAVLVEGPVECVDETRTGEGPMLCDARGMFHFSDIRPLNH